MVGARKLGRTRPYLPDRATGKMVLFRTIYLSLPGYPYGGFVGSNFHWSLTKCWSATKRNIRSTTVDRLHSRDSHAHERDDILSRYITTAVPHTIPHVPPYDSTRLVYARDTHSRYGSGSQSLHNKIPRNTTSRRTRECKLGGSVRHPTRYPPHISTSTNVVVGTVRGPLYLLS